MKNMKNVKSIVRVRKVATIWFLSYCIVLIIPVVISIFTYFQNEAILSKQVDGYMKQILYNKSQYTENVVSQIMDLAKKVSFDSTVVGLASSDIKNDKLFELYRGTDNFQAYNSMNGIIENTYIFFPKSDYILSSSSSANAKKFFQAYYGNKSGYYDKWHDMILGNNSGDFIDIFGSDGNSVFYTYSTIYSLATENSPIIIIEANKSSILESPYADYMGDFCILNKKGDIIASKNINESDEILKSVDWNTVESQYKTQLSGHNYIVTSVTSKNLNLRYLYTLEENNYIAEVHNSRVTMLIGVSLCLLLGFVLIAFSVYWNGKPIREIISKLRKYGIGDEHILNEYNYIDSAFTNSTERIDELLNQVIKNQAELNAMEICVLQEQINPHFFYNTLEAIRMVCEINEDDDGASMLSLLGKLLRYGLSINNSIVDLESEIMHIDNYVALMRYRYKNRISLEFNIDERLMITRLPKITLQPILENCIYHAEIGNRLDGKIIVSAEERQDDVVIVIEDNGKGFRMNDDLLDNNSRSGIGLKNINRRIKLCFGLKYGLYVESEVNKGTKVSIIVPKTDEEGNYA